MNESDAVLAPSLLMEVFVTMQVASYADESIIMHVTWQLSSSMLVNVLLYVAQDP